MKIFLGLFVSVFILVLEPVSGSAHSHSEKGEKQCHHNLTGVKIQNLWARATPGKATTGAAYMTIHNKGNLTDRLMFVRSKVANRIELHTHTTDNNVMRMRQVDGVNILARTSLIFKPGGYHLMLIGLHKPLRKGEHFEAEFVFKRSGNLKGMVKIMGVGASHGNMMPQAGHKHGTHKKH